MAEITIIVAILAARLTVPFAILRWPFWGMVASIFADTFDLTLLKWVGLESFGFADYQVTDKLLDIYYLSFGLYVSAGLEERYAKNALRALFFWRFVGVILFEFTGARWILFAAPNIFEFLYLALFGAKEFINRRLTRKFVLTALLLSALLKFPQEYVMHYLEFRWGFGNFFDGINELFNHDSGNK